MSCWTFEHCVWPGLLDSCTYSTQIGFDGTMKTSMMSNLLNVSPQWTNKFHLITFHVKESITTFSFSVNSHLPAHLRGAQMDSEVITTRTWRICKLNIISFCWDYGVGICGNAETYPHIGFPWFLTLCENVRGTSLMLGVNCLSM